MNKDSIEYAGFWPRFCAQFLDILIVLPLAFLFSWGSNHYRLFMFYYMIPGAIFWFFYGVYFVKRFGGSPGKLIMQLRIRKLDGEEVGYREAILRYLPEYLLYNLAAAVLYFQLLQMTDSQYFAFPSLHEKTKYLQDHAPSCYKPLDILQIVWVYSEFAVMLTNKKRRALHDFIAGTIVIRLPKKT